MKKQIMRIAALTLFVTTFAVASAHAQNSSANQKVTIPFDFFVGSEKLPAGKYILRAEDSRTAMRIQRGDQSIGTYFLIHPVGGSQIQDQSKLIFRKYGDQYFLSRVWAAGHATGHELNMSNRQRGLEREIAKRAGKSESVAVTMRAN